MALPIEIPPYQPFHGWGGIAKGQLHTLTGPMPAEVLANLPEITIALCVSEYLPHEAGDLMLCVPEPMVTWFEQWDIHGGTNLPGSKLRTLAEWVVPQSEVQQLLEPKMGSDKWASGQSDYRGRLQLITGGQHNGLALFSYSCGSCNSFACGNSCDPSGVSAGGWGGPLGLTLVHTPMGMEHFAAQHAAIAPFATPSPTATKH